MLPLGATGVYAETMTGQKVDPLTYDGDVTQLVGITKQKVAEQVDAVKYIPFKKKASFNPSLVKGHFGVPGSEHPKAAFYRLGTLGELTD